MNILMPSKRSVIYLGREFSLLAISDTNDTGIFSTPITPIFFFHYGVITIMIYYM